MDNVRTITGLIFLVLGVILLICSLMFSWIFLVYTIPIFIIGVLLLIDVGKENYIEPIKPKRLKSKVKRK